MSSIVSTLKGYRTLAVNAAIAFIGLLTAFGVIPVGEAVTPEAVAANVDVVIGAVAIVAAAINAALRVFTDTPVGKSE
jgi:hypothetical protein